MFMSGEVDFTANSDTMGAKRRCIEIGEGEMIPSEAALKIQALTENNYGVIGGQWLDYIVENKKIFREEYNTLRSNTDLKSVYAGKFREHFNLVAAAFVALKLFRKNFYGISEVEAENEAVQSVLELAEYFPDVNDMRNTTRAIEIIRDYIEKNKNYFLVENSDQHLKPNQIKGYFKTLRDTASSATKEYIGFKKQDILSLLKSKQFDSSILREFEEEKTIIVNKNRTNYAKTIKFNGKAQEVVLFLADKLKLVTYAQDDVE